MPDIDLDLPNRKDILDIIDHVPAMMIINGVEKRHNSGVYCQQIPVNPLTGYASIDYKTADARGYFKIDFLNVSIYNGIRDEAHLTELVNTEPIWELLQEKSICDRLFHINGHSALLNDLKPKSIKELAMVLALIRPGKKHLISKCKEFGFSEIEDEIWSHDENGYVFKKAHGIAYSHAIVVQLNLICEQLKNGTFSEI